MILTQMHVNRVVSAALALTLGVALSVGVASAQNAGQYPLGKPDIAPHHTAQRYLQAHPWQGARPPGDAAVTGSASAIPTDAVSAEEQSVFGPPPKLTKGEKKATDISGAWQKASHPMRGLDGSVVYAFGDGEPVVVCSPLQVCDIRLERGEQIMHMEIGDSARWLVQTIPAQGSLPPHIIVKPTDVGLTTSLVVFTDRRTYHIKLVSDRRKYTALTKFIYPRELMRQYQQRMASDRAHAQHLAISEFPAGPVLTTEQLDFHYRIKGDAYFRPVRVYNDGVHTIIQLPEEVANRRAPVLMIVNRNAPSSAGPTATVNYRMIDGRIIVDSVFHQAVLVSGVGDRAKTVTITLETPHSHHWF